MRLVLAHVRAGTLELLRHPSYSVPTLLFPTMFFAFFVLPRAERHANELVASYAGFAVLGIAFFQFGVGIAAERASPWERYVRTLPVAPWQRFAARVVSALQFAVLAVGLLVAVALAAMPVTLDAARWAALAVTLVAGAIPFALLGVAIGYLASPRGALPIANQLYLGLSYAGGLWTVPAELPHAVASASPFLPTRQFADVLRTASTHGLGGGRHWLWLGLFGAAAGIVARHAYLRDEGERFR